MTAALTLTLGTGPGATGLGLWSPGHPPAMGEVPAGWAEAAARDVADLLAGPGGLLLGDADVEAVRRERAAGERLAALVEEAGARALRDRLLGLQARGEARRLCVDARTPAWRDLPWELLAGLPPGRSPLAVGEVLRLQAAEPRTLPAPGELLPVRLWSLDPEDPVAAAALSAAAERVAATPGLARDGEGRAVLHLVSHGQARGDAVGVAGAEGLRAAETVARGLGEALRGATLVLADVCGGGRAAGDPSDSPAWRLAQEGVPVVVAPRARWAVEASRAFARGLYPALARGETVTAAVEAGRAALRALGVAHGSCRWWVPMVLVATPLAAELTLVAAPAQVPGWPPADRALGPVLRQALARAKGYLGVEHLLGALAAEGLPEPALGLALGRVAEASPAPLLDGPPVPTPRVAALGAELPAGFGAAALARSLAMVPWVARALDPAARARLLAPPGDDGRGTLPLEPVAADPVADPGQGPVLEVEGGPDDGRRLSLAVPGEVVGRWDPGQPELREGRLAVGRGDADRTLSRRHLVGLGQARVQVAGATRLCREGEAERAVSGELDLRRGDLLVLGVGTRLRVG